MTGNDLNEIVVCRIFLPELLNDLVRGKLVLSCFAGLPVNLEMNFVVVVILSGVNFFRGRFNFTLGVMLLSPV